MQTSVLCSMTTAPAMPYCHYVPGLVSKQRNVKKVKLETPGKTGKTNTFLLIIAVLNPSWIP